MRAESWQIAEIPGPAKAVIIERPKAIAQIIKRHRTVMVIGSEIFRMKEGTTHIELLLELSRLTGAHVAVTGATLRRFREMGYENLYAISAFELANRLEDPEWPGFDGSGNYSLLAMAGFKYYYGWLILSGLKHYSEIKTLSLDPYYQPHASYSLSSMALDKWESLLKSMVESLKR